MLRTRVITAALLAPLALYAVFFFSLQKFMLVWSVILAIAAWEWSGLMALKNPLKRGFFVGFLLLLQLITWLGIDDLQQGNLVELIVTVLAFCWWILIARYMRTNPRSLVEGRFSLLSKSCVGLFVLYSAWLLMWCLLEDFGRHSLIYLLVTIWMADSAAYFVGKRWGKSKLAPILSPGKTFEGMIGALVGGGILALSTSWLLQLSIDQVIYLVFLTVLTVVVSIYGDLFESLAKRVRGVKDSGTILPGHGGILDRIDSLLAAVPFFYAGLLMKEIQL